MVFIYDNDDKKICLQKSDVRFLIIQIFYIKKSIKYLKSEFRDIAAVIDDNLNFSHI